MPQCSNGMGQSLGQVLLGNSFTPVVSVGSLDGIQFVAGLVSVVQDDVSHRACGGTRRPFLCSSSPSPCSLGLSLWFAPMGCSAYLAQRETVYFEHQDQNGQLGFLPDSVRASRGWS